MDSFVIDPEDSPVPDWHRRLLQERLAAHRADPDAARPWEVVRAEIMEKIKNRRSPGMSPSPGT